jgi:Holliday junction resolvase RusA-like endonuclease
VRSNRDGKVHTYTPAASQKYKKHVELIARGARSRCRAWDERGPHGVRVRVFREANRGDGDNYLKAALDALQGVLWQNDETVHVVDLFVDVDRAKPRLEVCAWVLSADEVEAKRCAEWAEVLP